jgi:hypothetical protein
LRLSERLSASRRFETRRIAWNFGRSTLTLNKEQKMLTIKRGNSIYEMTTNQDGAMTINLYKQNEEGVFVFERTISIEAHEHLH